MDEISKMIINLEKGTGKKVKSIKIGSYSYESDPLCKEVDMSDVSIEFENSYTKEESL